MSNFDIPVMADTWKDFLDSNSSESEFNEVHLDETDAMKLWNLLWDVAQIDPYKPLVWDELDGAQQRDLCDKLNDKARHTKEVEFQQFLEREKAA